MKKNLLKISLAFLFFACLFAACSSPSSPANNLETPSIPNVQPTPTPDPASNPEPNSNSDPTQTSIPNPVLEIPLTIEALAADTTITLSRTDLVTNLRYSIDGAEFVAVSSSELVEIPLSKDSCISFYADGTNN